MEETLRPEDSAPLLGHAPPLDPRLLPLPPLPGNGASWGSGFDEDLPCRSLGAQRPRAALHPLPALSQGQEQTRDLTGPCSRTGASFQSEIPQPPRMLVMTVPLPHAARPAGGQCPHLTVVGVTLVSQRMVASLSQGLGAFGVD